jgi:hypothetical protein
LAAVRGAAACLVVLAWLVAATSGLSDAPAPEYLSLGDSLAVSIQPDADGHDRATSNGFSERVWRAAQATHSPSLTLVKLGRGGETAASMINSSRPGPASSSSPRSISAGRRCRS